MKQKALKLVAGLMLFGSIGYITGQFGSLECEAISIPQCLVRCGVGLAVLAFDTWLINYLAGEEGGYADCFNGR